MTVTLGTWNGLGTLSTGESSRGRRPCSRRRLRSRTPQATRRPARSHPRSGSFKSPHGRRRDPTYFVTTRRGHVPPLCALTATVPVGRGWQSEPPPERLGDAAVVWTKFMGAWHQTGRDQTRLRGELCTPTRGSPTRGSVVDSSPGTCAPSRGSPVCLRNPRRRGRLRAWPAAGVRRQACDRARLRDRGRLPSGHMVPDAAASPASLPLQSFYALLEREERGDDVRVELEPGLRLDLVARLVVGERVAVRLVVRHRVVRVDAPRRCARRSGSPRRAGRADSRSRPTARDGRRSPAGRRRRAPAPARRCARRATDAHGSRRPRPATARPASSSVTFETPIMPMSCSRKP